MVSRLPKISGSGKTSSASAPLLQRRESACKASSGPWTSTIRAGRAAVRAASCNSSGRLPRRGMAEFQTTATRRDSGRHLRARVQPLARQLRGGRVSPVTLPPGRARLATRPAATGSPRIDHDDGDRLSLPSSRLSRPGVAAVTMTSTLSPTSSAAMLGRRSLPSAQRYSIMNVLPFDVAELAQSPRNGARRYGSVGDPCPSDERSRAGQLRGLLRLGGARRSEQATAGTAMNVVPVHHWITSSARARTACGIVRPSALAVLD